MNRALLQARRGCKPFFNVWGKCRFFASTNHFSQLELSKDIIEGLNEMNILNPTEIQRLAVPALIAKKDIIFSAQTGSGKTLAYLLPIIELLRQEEKEDAYIKMKSRTKPEDQFARPRALVIVPTRELADQIYNVCRLLMHHARFRPACFTGGKVGLKKQSRKVKSVLDIVIGTPGKLSSMIEKNQLYTSKVNHLVMDEADVLLAPTRITELESGDVDAKRTSKFETRRVKTGDKGFWNELNGILTPILERADATDRTCQFVMASASTSAQLKKIVQKLFPNISSLDTSTLHQVPVKLKQKFIPVTGDKLEHMVEVLDGIIKEENRGKVQGSSAKDEVSPLVRHTISPDKVALMNSTNQMFIKEKLVESRKKIAPTLVFCNTVQSARAVEHYLAAVGFRTVSYHGDIPPLTRSQNFAAFADIGGEFQDRNIMIATDIAARGLDTSFVKNVILFDFPISGIDYLHRAGRTARANNAGTVISFIGRKDRLLANAIQQMSKYQMPLDQLKVVNRKVVGLVELRDEKPDRIRGRREPSAIKFHDGGAMYVSKKLKTTVSTHLTEKQAKRTTRFGRPTPREGRKKQTKYSVQRAMGRM